jgi:hypothetical protein
METELARYDAACRALAEARSVDEVREILNFAEAQRAYAKMAKNRNLEADAFEIRKRAERRLGDTIGLAKPGGDMRSEHRVSKLPTLAEAGIDKNLAHRARSVAAVPAEKFEQIIKEGREQITAEADRLTAKLIKAGSATQRPNGKRHDPSPRTGVDDQGAPSLHAQCVSLADLNSCWDGGCVAVAVGRVIEAALQAPDTPKLPAPEETKELVTTLRDWIGRLEPATQITQKALQPAEPKVVGVLNNFIHEFDAIDLHNGVFAETPKEVHPLKTALSKVYDLLAAILPYLATIRPKPPKSTATGHSPRSWSPS